MQELRDILKNDAVKGKHFFLESDIKGPALKLDNTGKAILTVSACLLVSCITYVYRFRSDTRQVSKLVVTLKYLS